MNTIAVPLTLILLLFVIVYTTRKKLIVERETFTDDQPIPDEITPMEITGQSIFLRNEEKEIWKSLNNAQRKAIVDNQRRNIKAGIWFKVIDDNGICTGIIDRKEAINIGMIKPDHRDTLPSPVNKKGK